MTLPLRSVSMKFLLSVIILTLFSAISYADDPIIRVLVVKTDNPAAYAKEIVTGNAILKKLKAKSKIRVWQASFAGPQTGTIVVAVEWKNIADFASDGEKMANSKEMAEWSKGLDAIRTIMSDSLYNELKAD